MSIHHVPSHDNNWSYWKYGCEQCIGQIVEKAFGFAMAGEPALAAEAKLVLLCVAPTYPRSAFLLGYIAKHYEDDEDLALEWCEMAAAQGDLHGMCLLADLMIGCDDMYVMPSTAFYSHEVGTAAMELYQVAAEGGVAEAQYKLGILLVRQNHQVVQQEKETGYDWILKAATQHPALGTSFLVKYYGPLMMRTKAERRQFRRKFLPWITAILKRAHEVYPINHMYANYLLTSVNTLLAETFWCPMLPMSPKMARGLYSVIWAAKEFYYQHLHQQNQHLWLPVEMLQHIFSFIPHF